MIPKYPDESIQSLVAPDPSWWVPATKTPARGSLVWTIIPYPDQKPFRLIPVGRGEDARQHAQAQYQLEEFRVGQTPQQTSVLPVAALPLRSDEEYLVRRSKRRPCLIIASTDVQVDTALARGKKRWQTALTRLVVPYYSANGSTARAGWAPELVGRIRRCEYPQYFWDTLPLAGSLEGSILRFDHTFSIGHDLANVEQTGYQLHQDALGILDEWLAWYVTGTLAHADTLKAVRELLRAS